MHIRLRLGCLSLVCALAVVVAGCTARGDISRPIPTALIPAPQAAQRLVVVLPGRADNLDALQRGGIAEAIHGSWPDADVLLAELTMPYYLHGTAPQRLHNEVIVPARRRGYREVWLSGASMGGMGSVMYDRSYPGEVDGIILLAPYLGDRPILREIAAAGGVESWDPGPSRTLAESNWQHEMWRHLQTWADSPHRTRNVWLAYGEHDSLRSAMPLLIPLLPREHVLVRPGGHEWPVWSPALGEVLQAASAEAAAR